MKLSKPQKKDENFFDYCRVCAKYRLDFCTRIMNIVIKLVLMMQSKDLIPWYRNFIYFHQKPENSPSKCCFLFVVSTGNWVKVRSNKFIQIYWKYFFFVCTCSGRSFKYGLFIVLHKTDVPSHTFLLIIRKTHPLAFLSSNLAYYGTTIPSRDVFPHKIV